jgi:hypothetical protein
MKFLLCGLFCGVIAVAQTVPIPVSLNQTQSFGMIGVALNQTGRLNVVNTAPAPTGPVALVACSLTLQLFDDQANKVAELAVDNLEPGKALHLDLPRPAAASNVTDPLRIQVRGVVIVGGPILPRPLDPTVAVLSVCAVAPTLEVFDNDTGKTQVVLTNASVSQGLIVPLM